MSELFNSLVRIASTLVVVANLVAAGLLALADDVDAAVFIALGVATVGPLIVALADWTRTAWVLPAFVTSLIGLGAALGVVGLGTIGSVMLLLALAVVFVVCVAGTLLQAQNSLQEPRNRF